MQPEAPTETGNTEAFASFSNLHNYTARGDSFKPVKPRVWSDRQVMRPNFIRVLDLHPDGKRFAVFPLPDVEQTKGTLHVTFLLNFADELLRRVPVKK